MLVILFAVKEDPVSDSKEGIESGVDSNNHMGEMNNLDDIAAFSEDEDDIPLGNLCLS